jgi:hypothetical protein
MIATTMMMTKTLSRVTTKNPIYFVRSVRANVLCAKSADVLNVLKPYVATAASECVENVEMEMNYAVVMAIVIVVAQM